MKTLLRWGFIGALVALCSMGLAAQDLSSWASSFGAHSVYRLPEYVSGFSMVERSRRDALETARIQALDDLVRKVRVSVRSEIVTRERDDGRRSTGSYSSVTRSSAELEVAEPQFLIDRDGEWLYALAFVRTDTLAGSYLDSATTRVDRFEAALESAEEALSEGRLEAAERALSRARVSHENAQTSFSVVRSLGRLSSQVGHDYSGQTEAINKRLDAAYASIHGIERDIERFVPDTYQRLIEHLARSLSSADYRIAGRVPLRYGSSDFSSEFGGRLVSAVADEIRRMNGAAGAGETVRDAVLEGGYWLDEGEIEMSLRVRDSGTGEVLATRRLVVPQSAADGLETEPADLETALANQALLIGEATVEGGISVEAWTNKGRDQEVLVFEEGEELQFYFRVNQPAFLRLTYELASGDLVMLEPQFYIGVDRVNRVVELPYRFVVVPPFGVERLIVTASSEPPPPADTHIRVIDGQQYEVFGSAEKVVGRTRGLARVDDRDEDQAGGDDARVGEASLTITTVREAE